MILARLERHHDAPVRDRRFEGAHHLNGAGKRGDRVVEVAGIGIVPVRRNVNIGVGDERVFFFGVAALHYRVVILHGIGAVESHEDRGELLARCAAPGIQKIAVARLHAGDEPHPGRPVQRILRVAVGLVPVGELFYISHEHGIVVLVRREAVHHGGELLACDLPARVEHALADAVDYIVVFCPDNGVRVVFPVLHVGEIRAELHLGRTLHAVEHGDDHSAGHGAGRVEFPAAHAVHVFAGIGVFYGVVAPP